MLLPIKPCNPNFIPPVYSTEGAAAFDLFSPTDIIIHRQETVLVHLGFKAEVPSGHVALLVTRSGLGCKQGLGLRNQVGVIDSDYRGEWMAQISMDSFQNHNHNNPTTTRIPQGARFLQCLIVPVTQVTFDIVPELTDTDRGDGGLGSTGA